MPRQPLESLTEPMFYVLMALCRAPMCGTDIASFVQQKTSGTLVIGPATLYTILAKFEKEQIIREVAVDGRRRTYRITEKGRAAYRAEFTRLQRCVADAQSEEV
ncbi:MAG: PadR family transcriptional regulator [Gemmiger sp.]